MHILGAAGTAHRSPLLSDTEGRPCKQRLACPTAPPSPNSARNRKPPCADLEVPSGTAMEERRQDWISPPFIPAATLTALPCRSSHPQRICSFDKLKAGGKRSENSKRSDAINRLPKSLLVSADGLRAHTQCKEAHVFKSSQLHSN